MVYHSYVHVGNSQGIGIIRVFTRGRGVDTFRHDTSGKQCCGEVVSAEGIDSQDGGS